MPLGTQTPIASQGIAAPQAGGQPSPPGNSTTSAPGLPSPAIELPPGSPPLGLDGFCPVELTENQHWVVGNRRWGAIHEGRTYLFAGREEQNRFLADPTRYAPVLSGDDVVKLLDEGKRVPGSRLHGGWFHGKIYLFASQESYQQFDKNPFRYVSKLEAANSVANRPPLR
jgi:protein disulfide-isomerase